MKCPECGKKLVRGDIEKIWIGWVCSNKRCVHYWRRCPHCGNLLNKLGKQVWNCDNCKFVSYKGVKTSPVPKKYWIYDKVVLGKDNVYRGTTKHKKPFKKE